VGAEITGANTVVPPDHLTLTKTDAVDTAPLNYLRSIGPSAGGRTVETNSHILRLFTFLTRQALDYNVTWRRFRVTMLACNRRSITYCHCVSVPLVIKYAESMPHILICGHPGCTIFFHITS